VISGGYTTMDRTLAQYVTIQPFADAWEVNILPEKISLSHDPINESGVSTQTASLKSVDLIAAANWHRQALLADLELRKLVTTLVPRKNGKYRRGAFVANTMRGFLEIVPREVFWTAEHLGTWLSKRKVLERLPDLARHASNEAEALEKYDVLNQFLVISVLQNERPHGADPVTTPPYRLSSAWYGHWKPNNLYWDHANNCYSGEGAEAKKEAPSVNTWTVPLCGNADCPERFDSARIQKGSGGVKLLKCSKCGLAKYCSRECQVADWPNHKKLCRLAKGEGG